MSNGYAIKPDELRVRLNEGLESFSTDAVRQ